MACEISTNVLPRPVLRETRAELATAREAGGGEGGFDHQVLGCFRTPGVRNAGAPGSPKSPSPYPLPEYRARGWESGTQDHSMTPESLTLQQVPATVTDVLGSQSLVDMHTHLYAPAFGTPVPNA